MATTTKHLKLTKPAGTEPVSVDVLNRNFDKIDAGVLEALRGKAAHNLLDNSDFHNPVNQRGKWGANLPSGYNMDRWRTWGNGATVSLSAGKYVSVEKVNIVQYLPEPYDRGVVTLAVKVCGTETPYICTYDTSKVGSTGNAVSTINREQNALGVMLTAGYAYEWAALYQGAYTLDTLPAYVPKGYATELAACMRYYQLVTRGTLRHAEVDNHQLFISYLPMRAKPTATVENGGIVMAGVSMSITGISGNSLSPAVGAGFLSCAVSANMPSTSRIWNDSYDWFNGRIALSADL